MQTTATKQTIGIGVLGCGKRIRSVLRRIPGLGEDIRICALHDIHADSIAEFRKHLPAAADAKVYKDHAQLCADPAIDWVFIGSYNNAHREHAVAALQAGKHVFCEKPMATTMEDTLAIRDAWLASGRKFVLGFVLRYSPHYRAIKKLLDEGSLGRLVSLEFNETLHFEHGGFIHLDWRRHLELSGGHLLEKCCHDLDLSLWMTGSRPRRVASFGGLDFFTPGNANQTQRVGPHDNGRPAFTSWREPRNIDPFTADKDIIDNQVAILEFENGIRASFHTNCSTNLPERRMYLCGTEGTLRADVLAGTVEWCRIGHKEERIKFDTGGAGGHGNGDEVLAKELRANLFDDTPPSASVQEGIESTITALAIDQAMREGRIVDLNSFWQSADTSKTSPEPICV